MVAVNVGGIPEIFGDQKQRLIPTDNPEAMAIAMIELYENKERHMQAAEMAKVLEKSFSLAAMSQGVEKVYF